MARVTVEDCKKIVPNQFELVVLASRRGRDIGSGSPVLVEKNDEKNAVIALREIATGKLNIELLRENVVHDFCQAAHSVDSLEDNKQEDYLELDTKETDDFDDDFALEMSNMEGEISFDEEDMSFEDENLDVED